MATCDCINPDTAQFLTVTIPKSEYHELCEKEATLELIRKCVVHNKRLGYDDIDLTELLPVLLLDQDEELELIRQELNKQEPEQ